MGFTAPSRAAGRSSVIPGVKRAIAGAMAATAVWAGAAQSVPPAPAVTPPALVVTADAGDAKLEALIPELMAKGGVPGLAAAIIRGGTVVWVRGFGVASAGSQTPVTADTVFSASSLGQPIFAYAVLRLAQRGGFDLDRPLPAYAPNYAVIGDQRIWRITARRILCHTTGFPNRRRGSELTIDFDPGERFSYSEEGYAYLQKAVEVVTGLPLDEFVRREVFGPLGMTASSYVWRAAYETTAAVGHDYLQQPVVRQAPANADAASSLYTTVSDYARFLAETAHPTHLDPATVAQMLRPEVEVAKGVAWGLGWGIEETGTRSFFWQWGDNVASRGFAVGCRDTGDGVVVLTNSENGLSVAEPIVTSVLGGTHPAFAWLDVEPYDSPARTIRERLVRAGVANGERGVYRTLKELERTYPSQAFTEPLLNTVGYELLAKKQPEAAALVLERNVKLYPKSWNAYDSLAEAYAAEGDVRSAIRFYKKSLAINPDNANAKAALRVLQEEKPQPRDRH
jgi:CubicO group peptidase (beta-lactamase class C family)